ncbi:hypothetical protein LMH87_007451 [Akanthomyces muscarius]|uniref:Uncharacterized protein n=1 Tax=Akanthomyces muscarius TaxID=2231603 RepID=A0A9W8QQT5_AKAMU|nr:hypothetical protein LMH87_007451 [Akanthomyces muscarius]KAJ4165838.1 hypothetical protein LMH87_007451 [Akanthomyces muscarius]
MAVADAKNCTFIGAPPCINELGCYSTWIRCSDWDTVLNRTKRRRIPSVLERVPVDQDGTLYLANKGPWFGQDS